MALPLPAPGVDWRVALVDGATGNQVGTSTNPLVTSTGGTPPATNPILTYAQNFTGAQTDTALITVSAGSRIVVTGFLIDCHNANTVSVAVRMGFGTATVPAYGSAGIIGSHPGIAAGSGIARGGGAGIVGIGADNEDLRITSGAPTSGSFDVDVTYYVVSP